jgi:hypothetical protein
MSGDYRESIRLGGAWLSNRTMDGPLYSGFVAGG